MTRTKLILFIFFVFLPAFTIARVQLEGFVPVGWVGIKNGVPSPDIEVPPNVLNVSKNSVCEFVAADPKTFKEPYATFIAEIRLPGMEGFSFDDASLRGLAKGLQESMDSHSGAKLLETKTLLLQKVKVFRSVEESETNVDNSKKKVSFRVMQYYLPDEDGVIIIALYSQRKNWGQATTLFEKVINKVLASKIKM